VDLEHIVQDSCSDDGTLDWLPADPRVRAIVEKDSGMYDAVNRGLRKASGELLAYLNCDEQYLPGALSAVSNYFDSHPGVEIVFADFVVVDGNGHFLCYRKVQIPSETHIRVAHLPTSTCSMFFRRTLLDQHGLYFDSSWRDCGDGEWVLRLLQEKIRMGVLRRFTAAFADTGNNMNLGANARREKAALFNSAPWWARKFPFAVVGAHRLKRLLGGIYLQKPFDYALYSSENPNTRTVHHVPKPTFLWKNRL
jgi:glycosyltransferase involved in cell wall biosynthesis